MIPAVPGGNEDLYPSIAEKLRKENRLLGIEDCFEIPAGGDLRSRFAVPKGLLGYELARVSEDTLASPYGLDLGTITWAELSDFSHYLSGGKSPLGESLRALHGLIFLKVKVIGRLTSHKKQIAFMKKIEERFQNNKTLQLVSGLEYQENYFLFDTGIHWRDLDSSDKSLSARLDFSIFSLFARIRGYAERNRLGILGNNWMIRHSYSVDYSVVLWKPDPTPVSLEIQGMPSKNPHSLDERIARFVSHSGKLQESMNLFSNLAGREGFFSRLKGLSINGVKSPSRIDTDKLLLILQLAQHTLTHFYLTNSAFPIESLTKGLRIAQKLKVVDLSDNHNLGSKSVLELIEQGKDIRTMVISRVPWGPIGIAEVEENKGDLDLVLEPLSFYAHAETARELGDKELPEEAVPFYRLTPEEYTLHRLGAERVKRLEGLLKDGIKEERELKRRLTLSPEERVEAVIQEIQKALALIQNERDEFLAEAEKSKALIEEVEKAAAKHLQEIDEMSVYMRQWLESAQESEAFTSEDRKTLESLKALRDQFTQSQPALAEDSLTPELEELLNRVCELENQMSELAAEVDELSRMQSVYLERGKFLQRNAKFRLGYGRIVEKLKNEQMGRAVLASGYIKEKAAKRLRKGKNVVKRGVEASYQEVIRGGARAPIEVVKITSTTSLTVASGVVGGLCGVLSVSLSGLTFGASLALEVIPLALAVLTPVLSASIDFGCGVLGKLQDYGLKQAFRKIDNAVAKRRIMALAQAGSLTFQDQLNMDLAFGFVYLWQSQLEFLTETDVIKFADAWVGALLTFSEKNSSVIQEMMEGAAKEGKFGLNSAMKDLTSKDVSSDYFKTVFDKSCGRLKTWDWQKEPIKSLLEGTQGKVCSPRELLKHAGVRWQGPQGEWEYWSADCPAIKTGQKEKNWDLDRRYTKAWAFGYRTFASAAAAQRFINLRQDHTLMYGSAMIDLIVESIFSLPASKSNPDSVLSSRPGGTRVAREGNTQYVVSTTASDHLNKKLDDSLFPPEMKGKPALSICPAIQRFDGTSVAIGDYFEDRSRSEKSRIEEHVVQFIPLLLEGTPSFFTKLDLWIDHLRPQLFDLVARNRDSSWDPVRAILAVKKLPEVASENVAEVVDRLIEEMQAARMDPKKLADSCENLRACGKINNRSPFSELLAVIHRDNRDSGCLIIPFTARNYHDWQLLHVFIIRIKGTNTFKMIVQGCTQEGVTSSNGLEKAFEEAAEEIVGIINETHNGVITEWDLKTNYAVHAITAPVVSADRNGPLSTGFFVAEYIRKTILCSPRILYYATRDEVEEAGELHRKLVRYLRKIGPRELTPAEEANYSEHDPDISGRVLPQLGETAETTASGKREAIWSRDPIPLGPPQLFVEKHDSKLRKIKKRVESKHQKRERQRFEAIETSLEEVKKQIEAFNKTSQRMLLDQLNETKKEVEAAEDKTQKTLAVYDAKLKNKEEKK